MDVGFGLAAGALAAGSPTGSESLKNGTPVIGYRAAVATRALFVGSVLTLCACASLISRPHAPPVVLEGVARADSIVAANVGTAFPGAVFLVARNGRVLLEKAYGVKQLNDFDGRPLPRTTPMRTTTMFDLASVTKVMATTNAIMLLVDRGLVDIDAPLYRYLPDFRGPHLDSITPRLLLSHASGLVQWQPLYYQAFTPDETYDAIRRMPLGWGVGSGRHYSDLGFMLLGRVVEKVSGRRLDTFVQDELFGALGLTRTVFRPKRHGFTDFAATESGNVYERHMVFDSTFGYRYRGDPLAWDGWRDHVLSGEVDDGNAWYANGGIAGHAGLFSTAADVRVLLDLLLARGTYAGRRYIRADVIDRFFTHDPYGNYLGWMLPAGLPAGSFAHTGFTGTWVLGVPSCGLSVVLLTNKQNMGPNARGMFPDLAPMQLAIGRALTSSCAG
ncbi:MAG: serine hydrolase [Gemmatimonadota bacterium]